jgi:hypothetical protein
MPPEGRGEGSDHSITSPPLARISAIISVSVVSIDPLEGTVRIASSWPSDAKATAKTG